MEKKFPPISSLSPKTSFKIMLNRLKEKKFSNLFVFAPLECTSTFSSHNSNNSTNGCTIKLLHSGIVYCLRISLALMLAFFLFLGFSSIVIYDIALLIGCCYFLAIFFCLQSINWAENSDTIANNFKCILFNKKVSQQLQQSQQLIDYCVTTIRRRNGTAKWFERTKICYKKRHRTKH